MSFLNIYIISALVLLGTWGLTGFCVWLAKPFGLIDVPNHRSSHSSPTPRAGGLGFVLMLNTLLAIGFLGHLLPASVALAFCGGLVIAAVGLWDDRWQLSASIRFVAHLLAAAWALLVLGFGSDTAAIKTHPYLMVAFFGAMLVSFVWCINLTNFMDGIDGLAGSEIVCVGLVCSIISQFLFPGLGAALWLLLAAATGGFLLLNWHPARIFMGDVGSGYLGFAVAAIIAVQVRQSPASLWPSVIMMSVFVIDATATLLRRFLNGERWYTPHRTHAFQVAAERWGHLAVVKTIISINLLWLAPLAVASAIWPWLGAVLWILALLPLTWVQLTMTRRLPDMSAAGTEPEPAL